MQTSVSKVPLQEGRSLEPGYALDPFLPLWLGDEPETGMALTLYSLAQRVDRYGNQIDFEQGLEEITEDIRLKIFSWYEIGLKAWKIKLYKAWRKQYGSFREFCEKAVGRTAGTINNWIRSARVLSQLISHGFTRLPLSPSVALELSRLEEADMADTWRTIIDRYQDHEITLLRVKIMLDDPLEQKPQYKNVRLERSQWNRLHEVASHAGVSPSKFLAQLLDGLLNDQNGTPRQRPKPHRSLPSYGSDTVCGRIPRPQGFKPKETKPKMKWTEIEQRFNELVSEALTIEELEKLTQPELKRLKTKAGIHLVKVGYLAPETFKAHYYNIIYGRERTE